MNDSIQRALVWSESNDQLESECMSFKDLYSEREKSNSIMHVGHWTPTFELFALSVKASLFWRVTTNFGLDNGYRLLEAKKIKDEISIWPIYFA